MVTVLAWAVPPAVEELRLSCRKTQEVFGWSKCLAWGQAQLPCWPCCCLRGAATPTGTCSAGLALWAAQVLPS